MPAPDRLIRMGVFGAPHGVRGAIRLKSLASEPEKIGAYGALTDAKAERAFVFESLRPLKGDILVAQVKGLSTREAAASLTGVEIFARRGQLPSPGANEFYYDDLVGLEAFDVAGVRLGRIVAILNYGAGDILEIAPEGGGDTLLAPFTKAVALEIDFEVGSIIIERPHEIEGERQASGREAGTRPVNAGAGGLAD